MAKNTGGEGKGQTKNVSPEQHEAARKAAKAKRNAAARARAHGNKASGQRSNETLFDGVRNDRREKFLETGRERREAQAVQARAILEGILQDTLRAGHAADSSTVAWARQAYEASIEMVELYVETDPEFFGDRNEKVKTNPMQIVETEMRKRLAGGKYKYFAPTVIGLTRNALYGVSPRAARKLTPA